MGAEIRVSYDTQATRLHAKAWLFHRSSGFSTAYIGSSNLTHSAQVSGKEWNVRFSGARNPDVIAKVEAVFETYWNSSDFEPFDRDKFQELTAQARTSPRVFLSPVEIRPEPFQEQLLNQLTAERERGHHRNLLVAATGTGKTVMAALDYSKLARSLGARPPPVRRPPVGDPGPESRDLPTCPARRVLRRTMGPRPSTDSVRARLRLDPESRQREPRGPAARALRRGHRGRVPPRGRVDLSSVAGARAAQGTPRADGDAGAGRWSVDPRVLRGTDRRRTSAVERDRPRSPVPLLVLRDQRRNGPDPGPLASRPWLRHGRPHERPDLRPSMGTVGARPIDQARRRRAENSLPGVLRQHRPRAAHGARLQRGGDSLCGGLGSEFDRGTRFGAPRAARWWAPGPILGRPVQRRRRPSDGRHGPVPPPDGQPDPVPSAARSWSSHQRGQDSVHRARLRGSAPQGVSVRAALSGPPGGKPQAAARADRGGLSIPPGGLPHAARSGRHGSRPGEHTGRHPQQLEAQGRGASAARRGPSVGRPSDFASSWRPANSNWRMSTKATAAGRTSAIALRSQSSRTGPSRLS